MNVKTCLRGNRVDTNWLNHSSVANIPGSGRNDASQEALIRSSPITKKHESKSIPEALPFWISMTIIGSARKLVKWVRLEEEQLFTAAKIIYLGLFN